MARAGVAHFESDLDETARCFSDQLLGAGNSLAGHELQRSHAGGLLEHMRKVRGTQSHQFSETLNRDVRREMFGDVILDFPEFANGKAALIGRLFGGDIRVFLPKMRDEEL